MAKTGNWREQLTEAELRRLEVYDQQIAMQSTAVSVNPGNADLAATLALLKYRRYLLQSKAAQRLKRRRINIRLRAPVAA